ncbi:MAG TPA: hypothetical protein VN785_03325 [Candidatus Angelobacter sp.]|nr:hypothetical protein [Candidatus Angelobacter sp.]
MATRIATRPSARTARSKRSCASQHASSSPRLSHHQRKCIICRHPERETIEEMFVHWHSASRIHRRFMLPDRSTIYDHAHATGLFAKRRRNMRYALEHMIERADECDISSHGIVAAIKAYASLTTSGEWVEPARRVIYTSVSSPAPQRESANHSLRPLASKSAAYVYPQPQSRPSDYPSNYDPSDGWWAYSDAQARKASALASSSSPSNGKPANHEPPAQNANPAPPANTSAPVTARAPQTTTHSSSTPAHSTTTTTPGEPQQTKTAPQSANSNRYTSGLNLPPTHTKQTPAPHSNRYK